MPPIAHLRRIESKKKRTAFQHQLLSYAISTLEYHYALGADQIVSAFNSLGLTNKQADAAKDGLIKELRKTLHERRSS